MQTDTIIDAERPRRVATGNWVVLIAVGAFAAGIFLPFVSVHVPQGMVGTTTLYRQLIGGRSGLVEGIGGYLFLFGGAVTVGTVSIIGIRLRDRRWVAPALAAAVAAWSLTWVGLLLDYLGLGGYSFRVGYWCILGSLVLAVIGAVMAVRTSVPSVEPAIIEG